MSATVFGKKLAAPRAYKKGLDNEEARRKREDNVISLRKTAREDQFLKRRVRTDGQVIDGTLPAASSTSSSSCSSATTSDFASMSGTIRDRLRELPQLVAGVNSDDCNRQLDCVTTFRKLLSIEQSPPIQEVIDSGVVPRMVAMLAFEHNTQIQFEAAWTLTNIASGSSAQTRVVLECGAVPAFVRLLRSPNEDVREQAVWALGNIAGDSHLCRDFVLRSGALMPLVDLCIPSAKASLLRNAVWAISNLCRGKPQPDFALVRGALPKLSQLLHCVDEETLTDTCWALSYISDDKGSDNAKIRAVLESGAVDRLVALLAHKSDKVRTPALRTVGNIVTGDDSQTQMVLDAGVLRPLLAMLSDPKKGIRKEACWALSNITAGSASQIAAVMEGGLFKPMVKLLGGSDWEVQKEAAWALSNATSGGSTRHISHMVECGLIGAFCDLLACKEAKILMVAMEGLENILREGKKYATKHCCTNRYCEQVEEAGGLDAIEELQKHENEDIYNKAVKLLQDYFDSSSDDTSSSQLEEQLAPKMSDAGTFSFGAGAVTKVDPFAPKADPFGKVTAPAAFNFGASSSSSSSSSTTTTVGFPTTTFAFGGAAPSSTVFNFGGAAATAAPAAGAFTFSF